MAWHDMTPHRITLHDRTWHDMTHDLTSSNQPHYFTSRHLTINHITSPHFAANHMASYNTASQHITTADVPSKHNRHHQSTTTRRNCWSKRFGLGIALVGWPDAHFLRKVFPLFTAFFLLLKFPPLAIPETFGLYESFWKFLITKFVQMCGISGWIEVFPLTYEAGPKQSEVKLQGHARSALAWR